MTRDCAPIRDRTPASQRPPPAETLAFSIVTRAVGALTATLVLTSPLAAQAGAGTGMLAPTRPEGPGERVVYVSSGFRNHAAGDLVPVVAEVEWAGEMGFDEGAWGAVAGGGVLLTPARRLETGFTFGGALLRDLRGARGTLERTPLRLLLGASYLQVEEPGAGTWRQWDVPVGVSLGLVGPVPGLEARAWAVRRPAVVGGADWHAGPAGGLSVGAQLHSSRGGLAGFGVRLAADLLVGAAPGSGPGGAVEWGASAGIGYLHTLF